MLTVLTALYEKCLLKRHKGSGHIHLVPSCSLVTDHIICARHHGRPGGTAFPQWYLMPGHSQAQSVIKALPHDMPGKLSWSSFPTTDLLEQFPNNSHTHAGPTTAKSS